MSLHLEFRPSNFDDVIGNEEIIESLKSLLKKEDCPHCFLFHGAAGCGKTTFARIIAKELQCSNDSLFEINSSNNRGIDTARTIIETMNLKPLMGDIKVYILDEVHMCSKDFMNAMLKPLEDTPKHVYFILCTTNPEKIINPLRKRCVEYLVENIDIRTNVKYLKKISEKFNKNIPISVLKSIAKTSQGSTRNSLILLEKILDIQDEEKMLKIIDSEEFQEKEIIDLCRILLNGSWKEIQDILKNLKEDPEKIRRAILGYMSSVLLNSNNPKAAIIIESFSNNFYDSGKAGLILACYSIFL